MSQYIPSYKSHADDIRVELALSNYATKVELGNMTHSSFGTKVNLASLKSEVNILDISKLTTVPSDLSKFTKEVQEGFTKKTDFTAVEAKAADNKTKQDSLKTKVDNNHLTTETGINN